MVIVENGKCVGCGLCAKICHEQCIRLEGTKASRIIQIDHALCSTCTQCIAVCAKQALSWNGVHPTTHEKDLLPNALHIEELFKQRRTVRCFRRAKIDRAILAKIVQIGTYAPTNNYNLRAIVVDDPATMGAFDAIIMRFVSLVYRLFYRPKAVYQIFKSITPLVTAKQKIKLEGGLDRGSAFESLPAAMIFVVGDPRILKSEASAQYSLYNMVLFAQVQGIGSRISAAVVLTLDRNRQARKILALQKHEHILGALDLGYPAVRFRNKVEGKTMPLVWAGEAFDG